MDNPNPIRYSDLIAPDSSITTLISQLDELIAKYDGAKGKIQAAAADVARSLQGVSGAGEEQRKAIVLATEESEKLVAEYRDLSSKQWQVKQAFEEATAAKREQTKIDKLITQINTSLEGSYNKLSAQYRLNKIRLDEMSAAERYGTEAGRKLEAETKAIYEEMNRLQKATGKAQLQVGQYERSLMGLVGVNTRYVDVLTDSTKRTELFSAALNLIKSPIGALIGAVGAVAVAFKLWKDAARETQTTGDALDREVAGWKNTWEVFQKSVSTFDFRGFIRGAAEAAKAGRELRQVLDEMFERTSSTRLLRASMSVENAMLEEAARNTALSYEERFAAAQKYLDNMQPIYAQEEESTRRVAEAQLENLFALTNRTKFASEEAREAAKQEFADNIKNYNLNEDLIKQAMAYNKAQKEVAAGREGMYGTVYDTQKKIIAGASEEVKAFAAFARQYGLTKDAEVKAWVDAEVAYQDARAASYNDQKRIVNLRNSLEAQQTADLQKQADARRKAIEDQAKAAEKAAQDQARAQEEARKAEEQRRQQEIDNQRAQLQFQIQSTQLQISITQEGTEEILALRLEAIEKQRALELFENSQKAEEIRQDEAAINAKYDLEALREEARFRQELARRDLAAARDLSDAEFSLMDKNEREKTLYRLEMERQRLEKVLELNETAIDKMTDLEVAAIRKQIEAIRKEMDTLGYDNLFEVMGISLTGKQQGALRQALGSVKDSLKEVADGWLEAADAAVKAAQDQVEAARTALDAQIEARNAGYANEVETARKELALAVENEKQALKERQKALRAQQLADSVEQASSLVTASANIWKVFSKVNPVLALAAIATMWGSFAASKVKAAQLTEQYGDGTVELLQGGSHASGHDIDLGVRPNGVRRRAEGGEFFAVINKKNSRRYRDTIPDVIRSFNDGTFSEKYRRASSDMSAVAVGMMGTDVTKLERDVSAIRRQGDSGRFVDGSGNVVYTYKNLVRKVRS